jgi:dTDP-4-dehydrorhamnose reductase
MKILITGAHGMLGRSLLAQETIAELFASGRATAAVEGHPYLASDLTDRDAVHRLVAQVHPDWVIHTAALTDVDLCETERDVAKRINLDTVGYLVEACDAIDAGLVQISTDYVFDGRDGPYGEKAQPHPLSFYGSLKLESERLVLEAGIKGIVLRTLWLYGYIPGARRNLVTWPLAEMSAQRSLYLVDDQWGNPTYVHDLARALLELCHNQVTGLFHMGGSAYMTRYQMAVEVARFFGLDPNLVHSTTTATIGQKAPRPLRSGLRSEALNTLLGRSPMDFTQGLQHMANDRHFRQDFLSLI